MLVGAVGSGKRTFARGRLGVLADSVDDAVLGQGSAVARVQELVRDPAIDLTRLADALAGRSVVMVDQVGCGVVPIDPDERACGSAPAGSRASLRSGPIRWSAWFAGALR